MIYVLRHGINYVNQSAASILLSLNTEARHLSTNQRWVSHAVVTQKGAMNCSISISRHMHDLFISQLNIGNGSPNRRTYFTLSKELREINDPRNARPPVFYSLMFTRTQNEHRERNDAECNSTSRTGRITVCPCTRQNNSPPGLGKGKENPRF